MMMMIAPVKSGSKGASPGQGYESGSSTTSPVKGGRVGLGQAEGKSIRFNDREGKR